MSYKYFTNLLIKVGEISADKVRNSIHELIYMYLLKNKYEHMRYMIHLLYLVC